MLNMSRTGTPTMTNKAAQMAAIVFCIRFASGLAYDVDVILGDGLTITGAQQGEQLACELGLVLGVLAAPGPALDLEEIAKLRLGHLVEIDEEFRVLVFDQPA